MIIIIIAVKNIPKIQIRDTAGRLRYCTNTL